MKPALKLIWRRVVCAVTDLALLLGPNPDSLRHVLSLRAMMTTEQAGRRPLAVAETTLRGEIVVALRPIRQGERKVAGQQSALDLFVQGVAAFCTLEG